MSNALCSCWLLLALLLIPEAAAAQASGDETAQARAARLFQEALRDYDRGEVASAIAKLEQAQATAPHPTVLYNLAQVLEAAGRNLDARRTFERYLAQLAPGVDPERERAVRAKIVALGQRLASLRIQVSPRQSAVRLDERPFDPATDPFVEPGPHRVEVTLSGFEPLRVDLHAVAGEAQHLVLQLRPLAPPLPPPGPTGAVPKPRALPLLPNPSASANAVRTWGVISVASGLTLAAGAAVLHVVNASRAGDWERKDRQLDAVPGSQRNDAYWQGRADNAELARSVRHWDGLELGLFVGAGLLAATGAGMWLTAPRGASGAGAGVALRREW
jgi:hypothetical protein